MGFASTKTFYRPIVESCEEADARGASSGQLRARTEQKIGKFLTADELAELRKPTPGAKGNYFAWALADLVQYKFLSEPPQYQLTEAGKRLAEYLRKNLSAHIDRGYLQRF